MNAITPQTVDRIFKIWEYQVSHGLLLIRSPKAPALGVDPERHTNIDIIFREVAYMNLPSVFRGVKFGQASAEELGSLEVLLGKAFDPDLAHTLLSEGRRFVVVAASVTVSENDWDIFESPIEYRSRFRGTTK